MSQTPDPAAPVPAAPEPASEAVPLAELLKSKQPVREIREIGGRSDGTDPTRYGDWEKNGRCIDF